MLLRTVTRQARNSGHPVAFIDVETLRDNPFPDVLIRLLVELIDALVTNLGSASGHWNQRRKARRDLRRLRARLGKLLQDPQEAAHSLSERTGRKWWFGILAKGGANAEHGPVGAALTASAGAGVDTTSMSGRDASFVRTKMQGLQAEAVEFRKVLKGAVDALGGKSALVVLDDFYFIGQEHQPDVLAYLQQVVKNLNIWLKVGAVEHRLNEFADGDPPRGLQLTQDAGKVPMDNTLADFDHTRRFLEEILSDICADASVDVDAVVTDGARERLVLASGGVPRDYLNLLTASLMKATRRPGTTNRPKNKVNAEDVSVAAPEFLKQKESDLVLDASPGDVNRLRERFLDVLNFCLQARKVNVFLVEARYLKEEQWGRDIAALSDLRFFHRLGNLTVKSSEEAYVGRRYEAFALDLSSYAGTRVRTTEIDFWTTEGQQKLRAVTNVYTPEIARNVLAGVTPSSTKATATVGVQEGQLSIFDAIAGLRDDTNELDTDAGN